MNHQGQKEWVSLMRHKEYYLVAIGVNLHTNMDMGSGLNNIIGVTIFGLLKTWIEVSNNEQKESTNGLAKTT